MWLITRYTDNTASVYGDVLVVEPFILCADVSFSHKFIQNLRPVETSFALLQSPQVFPVFRQFCLTVSMTTEFDIDKKLFSYEFSMTP